ncbi:MAG: hypothetical protein OXH92_02245 [Bryobacterales bacterium]|nr:hypothetical protein [Bryobacterales bacterium]MDE0432807.1 hypothetical protein [Bryobacterales bacterium]
MRIFPIVLLLTGTCLGGSTKSETDYSEPDCEAMGGVHARSDVQTRMGTYPDCLVLERVSRSEADGETLLTTHKAVAWEYDWGSKPYEALGQALHYAALTGALPGVAIILRDDQSADADCRSVNRLLAAVDYLKMRGVEIQLRFLGPGLDDCFEEEE